MKIDLEKTRRDFERLSKTHGFDPRALKDIIYLRNMGHTSGEIAELANLNRKTVDEYLERIKNFKKREKLEHLVILALILGAGAVLLEKILKKK